MSNNDIYKHSMEFHEVCMSNVQEHLIRSKVSTCDVHVCLESALHVWRCFYVFILVETCMEGLEHVKVYIHIGKS